ncbi:hypothetical protein [Rubritalea sp.]|uniref:hypothetical protein n=1 Tax=Rubritalea sp. TaxID=2109375 RepID=UPI003EFA2E59
MAKCNYCNTSTFIGGKRDGKLFFCDQSCNTSYYLMPYADSVPKEKMHEMVMAVYNGNCPRCRKKNGPVDVHKAYRVWSAILLTSYSTHPVPTCKSCAVKRQLGSIAFSGSLGWWGFPSGLIMTPIQLLKNTAAIFQNPQKNGPTEMLTKHVKWTIGERIALEQAQQPSPPPLPSARPSPPPLP